MEMPQAVKDAEARANALILEQAKQREGTPAEEATPPAPEQTPVVEETVTETPTTVEQPPVAAQPAEDFEAKYKVLKGKYDKEVPELASQVTFLIKKVGALEAALAEKANQTATEPTRTEAAPEPPSDPTSDPKVKYFTTEYPDIYEATDALVQVRARAIAKAVFSEEFEKLNRRLTAIEQGAVQKTKESFYEALNNAHPNWEEIQASAEWSKFLATPDEFSGIPRWQLVKDAYDKLDAARVIRFFDAFTNKGASRSSSSPSPSTSKIESRVAPGRTQNANPGTGGNGSKGVTRDELKQFYLDVSQGKWKGREAEMKKEEARLIRGVTGA